MTYVTIALLVMVAYLIWLTYSISALKKEVINLKKECGKLRHELDDKLNAKRLWAIENQPMLKVGQKIDFTTNYPTNLTKVKGVVTKCSIENLQGFYYWQYTYFTGTQEKTIHNSHLDYIIKKK